MTKQKALSLTSFLAIKYWPTWLGIFCLWLVAYTPFACRIFIGRYLGLLTYYCSRERRYITEVNIRLCFPELAQHEQASLTRQSFIENGIGLIETFTSWARDAEYFQKQVTFIGLKAAKTALAKGRGLLLLGAHYSTLDLGGTLLSLALPFAATYRPHNNPLFDCLIYRSRQKICKPLDRNNIRAVFRHLKNGGVLWYASDQDYHRTEHSVFAPFFDQPAATITTASRFAKVNNSPVFIIRHHRINKTNSYEFEFIPVKEKFPTGNDMQDATLINQKLETAIRKFPAQYLWMHKRFKTQSQGKPASPYINIKTSTKTLTIAQYKMLTADSTVLNQEGLSREVLQLKNGLHLQVFPGLPGKYFSKKHPARYFDGQAKRLRSNNIPSITVDSLFKVPSLELTAMVFYPPTGTTLNSICSDSKVKFSIEAFAEFVAQLHQSGFMFNPFRPEKTFNSGHKFFIANPDEIKIFPSSVAYVNRSENILQIFCRYHLDKAQAENFMQSYLAASCLGHIKQFTEKLSALSSMYSKNSEIQQ